MVFVHEFGHALGLEHEPEVSDSVMRPTYTGWSETVVLGQDDIDGIQALYGWLLLRMRIIIALILTDNPMFNSINIMLYLYSVFYN